MRCKNCGREFEGDFAVLRCGSCGETTISEDCKQVRRVNIPTVTLKQAREKFERHYQYTGDFEKDCGEYKSRIMQYRWTAYTNALKDHNILEEGE